VGGGIKYYAHAFQNVYATQLLDTHSLLEKHIIFLIYLGFGGAAVKPAHAAHAATGGGMAVRGVGAGAAHLPFVQLFEVQSREEEQLLFSPPLRLHFILLQYPEAHKPSFEASDPYIPPQFPPRGTNGTHCLERLQYCDKRHVPWGFVAEAPEQLANPSY
jgi:hypothetical protein